MLKTLTNKMTSYKWREIRKDFMKFLNEKESYVCVNRIQSSLQRSNISRAVCVLILWLKEQLESSRLTTDVARSIAGKNSGVSSLLTEELKDATDSELIKSHLQIHHENLRDKFLKIKIFQ
jgi:hypothetical protein